MKSDWTGSVRGKAVSGLALAFWVAGCASVITLDIGGQAKCSVAREIQAGETDRSVKLRKQCGEIPAPTIEAKGDGP